MKSSFRLSVAVAVCAVSLLCPALTRAAGDDEAARRTGAEALLNSMHTEQTLTNATIRVFQMVDKYSESLVNGPSDATADQKAAVQKAQDEAHGIINKQLSWDALKGDFIQAYAEAFTEDELKGLTAFYNSPIGQKLIEKQPAVTEKMGRLTQQKMMGVMPTIMQKIKEAAPKPPTAPVAPVAPPAPPTTTPAP